MNALETELQVPVEVLVDQKIWRLQRHVRGGEGDVGEEGLVVLLGLAEILDQLVGPERVRVDADRAFHRLAVLVIRLLRQFAFLQLGLDFRILHVHVERPLVPVVRPSGVEPVAALEAPLFRTPPSVTGAAQVPLTHLGGVVAGVLENLGDHRGVALKISLVARLALGGRIDCIVEGAQPDLDRIVPGQEHGARHRADRRDVEIGEEGAALRQTVEIWGPGDGAADSEIAEADVVPDEKEDVGFFGFAGFARLAARSVCKTLDGVTDRLFPFAVVLRERGYERYGQAKDRCEDRGFHYMFPSVKLNCLDGDAVG